MDPLISDDPLKSEARYRTIFERSHDAILLVDTNGKIVDVNPAGIAILGYESKEELLSLRAWATGLFEDREDLRRFVRQVSQNGYATEFEARLVGKNGHVFYAESSSSMILDETGKLSGYIIIIRDISKRKHVEEQIEKQNIRLSTLNAISMTVSTSLNLKEILESTIDKIIEILESSSVRIYLLDEKKKVLKLAAHKGLSPRFIRKSFIQVRKVGDGLLGKTVQECKTFAVDNCERAKDLHANALLEEGLQSTIYVPLICKGKAVGVMPVSNNTPVKFSEDDVRLMAAIGNQIGVAVDNANLYENLKNAYQDLKMAQEQLIRAEKLASLGKLAATIAHEINNPLAAVLTYIRLLRKLAQKNEFGPERSEEISRYLHTMDSEIARCGEIVKNLLAFSRHSKITIEEHSIESIIDKTIILIAHELEMKEIKLTKIYERKLPKIQCDAKQIQQAILNLVINASEAMAQGGTLTIESRRSKVAGYLEVIVSDTGYGIPEEDQKNIFEPFFTTKEEGKGVGLGLSVVYGIITRHNGFIDVKSELGKGSTFEIRLPYRV